MEQIIYELIIIQSKNKKIKIERNIDTLFIQSPLFFIKAHNNDEL